MATKTRPRRWSPLTCLTPASLSPSGLIILESNDGEVETLVRTNVELRYYGSGPLPLPTASAAGTTAPWNARDVNLSCHVTTHRIVLLDEKDVVGGSIPLPLVHMVQPAGGPSFRSPKGSYKVQMSTHAWGELTIVFRGGETSSYTQSAKHRDDALDAIRQSLKRKAWNDKERQVMKEALRPSKAIAARRVGVDAIFTQNELRHRENANLADVAFGGNNKQSTLKKDKGSKKEDIDSFLREATELIKVIHKYSATIERERASAIGASSTNRRDSASPGKDTEKLVGMMEHMGMTSALSEKQSGSVYHKQLARQLADFLHLNDKLTKAGGMMTLTDVYCLFNRARGTNMISPEDLIKALDLMKELKLGISKRSFSSGVIVIQDDAFDDEVMAEKLAKLASSSIIHQSQNNTHSSGITQSSIGGITVMDVCRALKTSALLANEQLLSAEQMGWLCRDSTIEGVRFFPNLFKTGDFSSYSPLHVR
ncbi:hypothetical protein ACHAXR_011467 [Thalassiosira sp. AJA248-18]